MTAINKILLAAHLRLIRYRIRSEKQKSEEALSEYYEAKSIAENDRSDFKAHRAMELANLLAIHAQQRYFEMLQTERNVIVGSLFTKDTPHGS